ncbi:hypothetical protein Tco_1340300 [Tanacetum coccineum]
MKRGFQGAPRPLLPSMLLVATNPTAGQEHAVQAQSQPSPTPPPIQTSTSPPPPIPSPTPLPIPTSTSPPPPISSPTPPPIPHLHHHHHLTKAHASGEEQVEDISPNTLEAAKTLSKVASLKSRYIDKGRRYKRRIVRKIL